MSQKVLFILFSLISCFSFAQSSVWKIEKEGKSIYLGGTVHILREQDYPLPKEFEKAYKKADVLVFEASGDSIQNPQVIQQMMQKAVYTDGTTLDQVLDQDVYVKLENYCNDLGLPFVQLKTMKPSMLVIMMSVLKLRNLGMDEEGVDLYFTKKANGDNKKLNFLESVEEQIDMIMSMGEGYENEFVRKSLEDFDEMEDMIVGEDGIISDWKSGTKNNMLEAIVDMQEDYPKVYKSLLKDRNDKWIPVIESYFTDDQVEYVLVGSLHLYGEDGVLTQLENRGYRVRQL